MPIYEYHCLACGEKFERLVSVQTAVTCPACASPRVGRDLSVFGMKRGSKLVGSGGGGGCGCGAGG
jgi:putative FmdB family regulatory protein